MRKLIMVLSAALLPAMTPTSAQAWWNADWKTRTSVTLNTSDQGVPVQAALQGVVVPVRLHSGNFDFLASKPDGSDLRVVAVDDKTPLKFWVERFDGTNELALIWVQVPNVMPGTDKNAVYVYGGNEKAAAEPAESGLYDANAGLIVHFAEKDGQAVDIVSQIKSATPVERELNGLLGAAVRLDGKAGLTWSAADKAKAPAAGPWTASMWVKANPVSGVLFQQGALQLSLKDGKVQLANGSVRIAGGSVPVDTWTHVAVSVGAGKVTLYVAGEPAGDADVAGAGDIGGDIQVGAGLTGLMDELQVHAAVRSADWVKLAQASQSADAKLISSKLQAEGDAEGGEGGEAGYMGVLLKSLTLDAKIVIAILAVMFFVAAWVMVTKSLFVGKTDKDNRAFLDRFRNATDDLLHLEKGGIHPDSSLFRLYQAGVRELVKRKTGQAGSPPLSGASIDAVKAAIDADLVRESHTLNARMVLLTIAISGGPFLGLLGTVVGVMITFAAIAAAGDVNVNAIAPGIAAALLATVAGLAVAIPALFGYNYLASRIKNISADMQIFVDEFVTRVAENYGSR